MIESKEQLTSAFFEKADAFLQTPSLMTGIDLDDAAVTLKRYVLSELHDQGLGSVLAEFPKRIRQLDVDGVARLVADVRERLTI